MPFPFLALPAELRNRIYELTIANDNGIKIKYRKDVQGNYAALTHVCRQIRQEYLPIRRREVSVSVSYDNLEKWLSCFKGSPAAAKLRVVMTIDSSAADADVDMLPLLYMLHASPYEFECIFEFHEPEPYIRRAIDEVEQSRRRSDVVGLNSLVNVQNEKWLQHLCERDFDRVLVNLTGKYVALIFCKHRMQAEIYRVREEEVPRLTGFYYAKELGLDVDEFKEPHVYTSALRNGSAVRSAFDIFVGLDDECLNVLKLSSHRGIYRNGRRT